MLALTQTSLTQGLLSPEAFLSHHWIGFADRSSHQLAPACVPLASASDAPCATHTCTHTTEDDLISDDDDELLSLEKFEKKNLRIFLVVFSLPGTSPPPSATAPSPLN